MRYANKVQTKVLLRAPELETVAIENPYEFKKELDIVLADDDEDDCQLFEETLSGILPSAQLTKVHDGEQLMNFLGNRKNRLPDVVFLDINMPRKNGIECLKLIRSNMKFRNVQVIIYTTSADKSIMGLTRQIGANHFILKPNGFSEIGDKIKMAVGCVSEHLSAFRATELHKNKSSRFLIG